jgi:hypothetical protein
MKNSNTNEKREKGPCPALSPALYKSLGINGTSGGLSYPRRQKNRSATTLRYMLPVIEPQLVLPAGAVTAQFVGVVSMLEV